MIETLGEHRSFGGVQGFYRHTSAEIGLPMRFGVYRPPQALAPGAPPCGVLVYLAGLTCTEDTFAIKAGAQQHAARHGLILLTPDTSPRQTGVEGADEHWDFGHAAGFYLDAQMSPWSQRWRMESYLVRELIPLVVAQHGARADRIGLFGHSMGGHGALTLALRHPSVFQSVSAFAPICAPSQCPWGVKAFSRYLGEQRDHRERWNRQDATQLILDGATCPPLLVDQGLSDAFLAEQLHPHLLESACTLMGQPLTLRRHAGHDHGYYFIASFMADHLDHHAATLNA